MNSGSSANLLSCLAIDLKENDEVITPACTFPTTVSPIIFFHAIPIFCDISPGRFVPSVEQVLPLITPKTKAVLIPDLVGDVFDFQKLKEELSLINRSDIILIEDACDTITTMKSNLATCSFYASHIINAGGLGGMVLTDDELLIQKCKQIRRNQTWDLSASAVFAAFGLENSNRFDEFKSARHKNFLKILRKT